jgi:hypothetical protein
MVEIRHPLARGGPLHRHVGGSDHPGPFLSSLSIRQHLGPFTPSNPRLLTKVLWRSRGTVAKYMDPHGGGSGGATVRLPQEGFSLRSHRLVSVEGVTGEFPRVTHHLYYIGSRDDTSSLNAQGYSTVL